MPATSPVTAAESASPGQVGTIAPSGDCGNGTDGADRVRCDAKIRVLLVDPVTMTRQCFSASFGCAGSGLEITAVAEAPTDLPEEAFDVCVAVAGFRPARSEAVLAEVAKLRDLLHPVPVVVLAGSDDPQDVALSMEIGVRGYVSADLEMPVAIAAIRLVAIGGRFIPASSLLRMF